MALPSGNTPFGRQDLRRAVGALRGAVGWGAVGWFVLLLLHFALRWAILRWKPEIVTTLWRTSIANLDYRMLDHLFQMRLVFLVLLLAWAVLWIWERRLP